MFTFIQPHFEISRFVQLTARSFSSQVFGNSEVLYIDQSERPEVVVQNNNDNAIENVDVDTARFRNYVSSKEKDHDYAEIYRREHCEMCWLRLMVFGDSGTGKTRLINQLLNKPYSDSTNQGKLQVSNCIITGTDTTTPTWITPRNTFCERVKRNDNNSLEVKIWDVSFDWGAHNSHKVFLTPSSVCLLVLNVGRGLNTPVSGNERQISPLESLDHWLQMIDMCTNYDINENHSECALIVLTLTDLIDPAQRESTIHQYKKEIAEHIQSKHTCRYVDPTIFVVDDSEMTLRELRKVVADKGKTRLCVLEKERPLLWLKLQSDIEMFCEVNDLKYMSLNQVLFHVEESYGMSIENLKEFLKFHLQYRSLLFDPFNLSVLDSTDYKYINGRSCLLVTDPCFVDEAFRDVISLWKTRVFPKSPNSCLKRRHEMNLDFKQSLISLKTLTHLWADLDVKKAEDLAAILVRFHLLIPDTSSPPVNNNRKYFVPAIVQSLTSNQVENSLHEFGNLTPLIYWFDRSCDPQYREMSGFSTGIFFCKLVTILKDITPEQGTWKLQGMFADVAIFRVGPQGQMFVHISSKSCAIIAKLACLPNSVPDKLGDLIQDVRYWIELGIQEIIQDIVPGLYCSVCVSPCGAEFTFDCLERLGGLGLVTDNLQFAVCKRHDARYLHPDEFRKWFWPDTGMQNVHRQSFMEKQEQKDILTLRQLAHRVGDRSTLLSLALTLHVTQEKVDIRMANSPRDIEAATFDVLFKDWYRRVPGTLDLLEWPEKYNALQEAKAYAGLTIY